MNSDRTCLFLVEYRCVYCLSILDLDFLFISDKISVRNCFLVLDYHVSADWDIFKLCYAVLVCDRRNINLTSCVRCSSQVELDTLDVSLSLSSLMNYDRACFLDILKSDFRCFIILNGYFLFVSYKVSRRDCRAVLCDDILADNKLIEHCYAIFIRCRFKLQVLVCIRNSCCKELNALDIEITCCCLCDLYRATFLLVCHFSLDDIIVFSYFKRIRRIVYLVNIRC